MAFLNIPLDKIWINSANDRHGELENETAAIGELFRLREQHMKKLAEDIVSEGEIYDPPLVSKVDGRYVAYDGNRRLTCLKLITKPNRAPTQELRGFFENLRENWPDGFPISVICQVEDNRDKIDAILFRRHTGSQGGVGQSKWDDRAQRNFVERTGRGGKINVADEIEALLTAEGRQPERVIPRSTLNRLLSSELNRARVGVSVTGNKFSVTHEHKKVIDALERVCEDLASRKIVLGDLWDNQGKLSYLNRLEGEGVLPSEDDRLKTPRSGSKAPKKSNRKGRPPSGPKQNTFVPTDTPAIPWRSDQVRLRTIWDELQGLRLDRYPNAASALLRMLLELTVRNYLDSKNMAIKDGLATQFRDVAGDLLKRHLIDDEYFQELERLRLHDELISIRSMQRFLHSENFTPNSGELTTYWARLRVFLLRALSD